ncbi:MAG: lysophospholipid acyltransferase family protein [Candidatus Omnitrophica bacterium]|nr:lysophospholipid acyltransferase family protein [Candidatus Omnitrophota bacterium]
MIYWVAHLLFWILFKSLLLLKAFEAKKIPQKGGYIIASNHLSNLDPMILGVASGRKLSYFAKSSLFKDKFSSFFLSQFGAFPVRRGLADPRSIKEALRRLRKGQGLVMFPQGGRQTSTINLENIKPGVGMIAAKAGVPIIPAYISGSDKAMAPKSKLIKPAKVTVYFGSPIYTKDNESYQQIADVVMRAIQSLSFEAKR